MTEEAEPDIFNIRFILGVREESIGAFTIIEPPGVVVGDDRGDVLEGAEDVLLEPNDNKRLVDSVERSTGAVSVGETSFVGEKMSVTV